MLTLDSSVTMAWCFEDEWSPLAEGVLDRLRHGVAYVPAIWPLEVGNALLIGERRRRLSPADRSRFVALLADLSISVDDTPGLAVLLGPVSVVARGHNLSLYDASYLDLAMRRGLPLATLDRRLQEAAERMGVSLVAVGANGVEE